VYIYIYIYIYIYDISNLRVNVPAYMPSVWLQHRERMYECIFSFFNVPRTRQDKNYKGLLFLPAKCKGFHCAHFDIISSSSLPLISDIKPAHDNL